MFICRGTFIEHLLETTADGREGTGVLLLRGVVVIFALGLAMREACLIILSEIIQRCEILKYETLEQLNRVCKALRYAVLNFATLML